MPVVDYQHESQATPTGSRPRSLDGRPRPKPRPPLTNLGRTGSGEAFASNGKDASKQLHDFLVLAASENLDVDAVCDNFREPVEFASAGGWTFSETIAHLLSGGSRVRVLLWNAGLPIGPELMGEFAKRHVVRLENAGDERSGLFIRSSGTADSTEEVFFYWLAYQRGHEAKGPARWLLWTPKQDSRPAQEAGEERILPLLSLDGPLAMQLGPELRATFQGLYATAAGSRHQKVAFGFSA